MWLWNKITENKFLLAKYYPNTGWYPFEYEEGDFAVRLNKFFEANAANPTMWGDNDFKIIYEQEAEHPSVYDLDDLKENSDAT
jgi:hypothetical protein